MCSSPAITSSRRPRAKPAAAAVTAPPTMVLLSGGRKVLVDAIVAMCGYRPDHSILSELALDISGPAEGAGPLMRALANVPIVSRARR